MEEFVRELENGNYQKAREGFQRIYDNTKSIVAFYYLTMIDYQFNSLKLDELVSRFTLLYHKGNLQIKNKILPIYLSILIFDLEDYKQGLITAKKEYGYGNREFIVCFGYGYCLYNLGLENENKIISLIEEGFLNNDVIPQFKLVGYEIILKAYLSKKDYQGARQILGKLTLIMPQEVRLHLLNLLINISEDDSILDEDSLDAIMQSIYMVEFISIISNHFYNKKDYYQAIKYLDMGIEKIKDEAFIRRKAICLTGLNKFNEAISLIDGLDKNKDENKFLKAEILYFRGDKESLILSSQLCKESIDYSPNAFKYRTLGDIYKKLREYTKLQEVIEILKKEYPSDPYYHVLQAHIYCDHQDFDRCEKEIKLAIKKKNEIEFVCDLAYSSFKNPTKAYELFRKAIDKSIYLTIVAKYYGEFGYPISSCQKELDLLDKNNLDASDLSLLGRILLDSDKDKAITYFKKGMDRYLSRNDESSASLTYYAYCLYKGYGVKQNVEEAYTLLSKVKNEEVKTLEENFANLYAEISILLNKDLEEAYSFLVSTNLRRYSLSRLFEIIKVGKLLNKNVKKYQKQYLKALKFANQREREYYLSNPDEFMMNNA